MTEDQNQPSPLDRRQGDDPRAPGPASAPVPRAARDDHQDLRDLFRATAPNARRVDVEALFSAAQAWQPGRRRLARSRWIGRSRNLLHRTAKPLPWRRTMLVT